MSGSGGAGGPEVVAFDIIGTVFPLEPLRTGVQGLGLPPNALEGWFAAGLRDAFALAAAGDFKPFTEVLEGALGQVAAEQGVETSAHDRSTLVKQLQTLDARGDARVAFDLLAGEGVRILALTNGSRAATEKLLKHSGLDDRVEAIVSVDDVKRSKPRAEVYLRAAETAGVEPQRLALIAAHPWDINGAKAAGLLAGFLETGAPYPTAMRAPDVRGRSLPEVAQALLSLDA